MLNLMDLPFALTDWEPFVSERTVSIHYGKHHQGYVEKVNELIIGTEFRNMDLVDIIQKTYDQPEQFVLYSNAGQVYNHNVYWQSFGFFEHLDDNTKDLILMKFGSKEILRGALIDEAMKIIGSGWVWLVENNDGKLEVLHTYNGDTPVAQGLKPLFNVDVWEHAYYLDYQNQRKKYLENFISGVLKI